MLANMTMMTMRKKKMKMKMKTMMTKTTISNPFSLLQLFDENIVNLFLLLLFGNLEGKSHQL
jgi:hypothetical protein